MASQKTLIIRIKAGNFTQDAQIFGKMDPYVVVQLGAQQHRTKPHYNAGKHAQWNEEFAFKVKSTNETIKFAAFDKDLVFDDNLGSCQFRLNQKLPRDKIGKNSCNLPLCDKKNNLLGQIQIEYEYQQ